MMESDAQLLRQFVEQDDHEAFGKIVNRYLDVAYSASMSCLREDHLAQDACQLTFLALARKASGLSEKVVLGGWVFNAARNFSRKLLRAEIHRKKREQVYMEQVELNQEPEIDLSGLIPEIHEAMERIKPVDREAILLRFFQHKSLREVGEALGLSSDAARMRLNRAVRQLNKQLVRKGIRSTASALAVSLPAHAALSAPANLGASISAAALAGSGVAGMSATTLTGVVLTIMKMKTVIIVGAVAASAIVGAGIYTQIKHEDVTADEPLREPLLAAGSMLEGSKPEREDHLAGQGEVSEGPTLLPELGGKSAVIVLDHTLIDSEALHKAEQQYEMIEALAKRGRLNQLSGLIPKKDPEKETRLLVKKLQLRLGLDEEQVLIFQELLLANAKAQEARDPWAGMQEVLNMDRDLAIHGLAMEMMKKAQQLTPEQQQYHELLDGVFDQRGDDREIPAVWDKNTDIMEQLNNTLSLSQREELSSYLQEGKIRSKERRALSRSNELAEELGLNEADRGALYDYLYEHPKATREDIEERLAPELRELLRENSASDSNPFSL